MTVMLTNEEKIKMLASATEWRKQDFFKIEAALLFNYI